MKIHAFGDSFTNAFNDENAKYVMEYLRWKGYKPKSFVDIVSEYYKCDSINYAKQGFDNYSIFESICENHHLIKSKDIIIINWTSPLRFRIVCENDNWTSIVPNIERFRHKHFSRRTINEIILNRESEKYINEVLNWSKLISKTFKGNKVFQWTTNYFDKNDQINFLYDFEKIYDETRGEVEDGHFSEKGHLDLANTIIDLLENGKKLI